MKATKKPIEIEYYPVEYKYIDDIMFYSRDERPIIITADEKTKEIIKVIIVTLEGKMEATKDDVIIIGVSNEVYPCKKDIFEKTYTKSGI